VTRRVTTIDDNKNIQETTLTKRKTMYAVNQDNLTIATNKTGDMLLVRCPDYSMVIVTNSGSVIHQGSNAYVLKKWENKKNT